MTRIELTEENLSVNELSDENDKRIYYYVHGPDCDTEEEAEELKQQILADTQIMDEFEQGWKDIGKYMRENKIQRGKLIGENLLLHDKLEKFRNLSKTNPIPDWLEDLINNILEEK